MCVCVCVCVCFMEMRAYLLPFLFFILKLMDTSYPLLHINTFPLSLLAGNPHWQLSSLLSVFFVYAQIILCNLETHK